MQVFLLVTVTWVFSVCLHEFGHALVAFKGGDHTVKEKGYLTLNPIHYTHPVYSLVMPLVFLMLGGIGLPGGAVYINDHLLRSNGWRTATSLAGPAMNVILTLLLCLPFWTGLIDQNFGPALAFLIQLQISSVLFNLLPLPPLDGFHALAPWLPEEVSERLLASSNMVLWILFLVMWNVPVANHAFWAVTYSVSDWLRIDPELIREGWFQFQFWKH
jgi:Zn-dependent protease